MTRQLAIWRSRMWILFCSGSSASLEVTSGWAALFWGIWVQFPGNFRHYVINGWTFEHFALQYFGGAMIVLGLWQIFAAIMVRGRQRKWPAIGLLALWTVITVETWFIASYTPAVPVYAALVLGNFWILLRGATHDRWKGITRDR